LRQNVSKLYHYYKLIIEYDGTLYHGWQKQPHHTTIQANIENALSCLTQETIKIIGAGRTDAGVHALGQVAHFQLNRSIAPATLLRGINALLPCDIVVKEVKAVDSAFHARYGARRKTYRYFIYNSVVRSPWKRKTSWQFGLPLDISKMRKAAQSLIGTHDFSSFCATDNDAKNHIVDFLKISISKKENQIQITLTANRFLRYMVRNIVGLLVEIGQGRRNAHAIAPILEGKDRNLAGRTAPPHGLFLMEVKY
jgi:tRNA pseudouridine38-40 synthase